MAATLCIITSIIISDTSSAQKLYQITGSETRTTNTVSVPIRPKRIRPKRIRPKRIRPKRIRPKRITEDSSKDVKDTKKININLASLHKLQTLPGVGPKKAARIIAWRKKRGPFRRTKEIIRVRGFGRKTYKKLQPLITVKTRKALPKQKKVQYIDKRYLPTVLWPFIPQSIPKIAISK